MSRDVTQSNSFWLIKTIFFLGLVLVVLIGLAAYREMKKKQEIQLEISKLQEEAKKIERDNIELSDKIAYLDSRDYKEKEAKDKLNLQSPDENLVVIKPSIAKQQVAGAENTNPDPVPVPVPTDPTSNFKKWWNYFFK